MKDITGSRIRNLSLEDLSLRPIGTLEFVIYSPEAQSQRGTHFIPMIIMDGESYNPPNVLILVFHLNLVTYRVESQLFVIENHNRLLTCEYKLFLTYLRPVDLEPKIKQIDQ